LRVGRVVAAVRDVVANSAAKKHGVLQHESDLAADALERVFADVAAVNEDPARARIIKAVGSG
jgi:hypothetical protein